MALNDGYLRFEGSAYFGFDPEGDGYDAIVIVGATSIEIRDVNDNVLSIWAPGAYRSNGQEPPLLAYFSGDEWLAPQDEELRQTLDRFISVEFNEADEEKPGRFARILVPILTIAVIVFAAYYLVSYLALRLLDPTIRAEFDRSIIAQLPEQMSYCQSDQSAVSRDYIRSTDDLPQFDIVNQSPAPIAILPSGRVLLRANFVAELGSEQGIVAALQIARAEAEANDIGKAILDELDFAHKLRFLSNGAIEPETIYRNWYDDAALTMIDPQLLRNINPLLGDYGPVIANLAGWNGQNIESEPAEITLSDQEWMNLTSLCENRG